MSKEDLSRATVSIRDDYSRSSSQGDSTKAPSDYLHSLSKEEFGPSAISSSCPQTGFMENNRLCFKVFFFSLLPLMCFKTIWQLQQINTNSN